MGCHFLLQCMKVESEKWKWSRSVVSDSWRPHGLQPTRLLHPWDFPGKSTGVGCHCLLHMYPLGFLIDYLLQISRHFHLTYVLHLKLLFSHYSKWLSVHIHKATVLTSWCFVLITSMSDNLFPPYSLECSSPGTVLTLKPWTWISHFFFALSLFLIGVELIYKIVFISTIQQSESVIHVHIFTLLKIFFPM